MYAHHHCKCKVVPPIFNLRDYRKSIKSSVCSFTNQICFVLLCQLFFQPEIKLQYWIYNYVKKNAFSQTHFQWALITFEENDEFIIRELSSYRCATSEGQQVNSFILCHSLTKISKCQEELNFFFWSSSSLSTSLNLTSTRYITSHR